MTEQSSIYQVIFGDDNLNDIIETLTYNQFLKSHSQQDRFIKVEFAQVKKCVWLASLLANSDDDNHRRKVQLFAMLVYLAFSDDFSIERASLLLLSRVGNFTATRHLKSFQELNNDGTLINSSSDDFDALIDLELSIQLQDKTLIANDSSFLLTGFQKKLWQQLNTLLNISVSAPTSAGKSFIIKNFIKQRLSQDDVSSIIYIVPSRALINQVSEDFRTELKENVEIRTSFLEYSDNPNEKSHLYILTPERCLKLIQYAYENEFKLTVIFVDEIQNVEDEKGRGTVLEFVLNELSILFPKTQIIVAGPNIKNNESLFKSIFDSEALSAKTELSPVFQLKTIIKPTEDNNVEIVIKPLPQRSMKYQLDIGFDLGKKLRDGIGYALAQLISYFANEQSNIIYCPRSDYAELWARRTAEGDEREVEIRQQTKDLIGFLEDEVHPSYYLIDCLKKNIAFHHSKLPDIVRKEIEDGFLEGSITKLFCTSTLIEGVNLPANNLFIISPKILNDELPPFRFGNLIGRAGRLKDSLYGTIYCIERTSQDEWAEEYYDLSFDKEVASASDKAIRDFENFQQQVSLSVRDISSKRDKNTVILIRQKFMRDETELRKYLMGKQIPKESVEAIIESTRGVLSEIKIPYEITRKNPNIDPVLQNELFDKILESGIEKWCIHKNKNFEARIKADDVRGPYEEFSFFWQLVDLLERLNEIFNIMREVNVDHSISISLRQMAIYGVRWTTGEPYQKLIREDINFMAKHTNPEKRIDPNNRDDINKRINTVIKINSIVVSHVLVKYFKLLNDLLEPLMTLEQKESFKFSLALPTMLELGTRSTEVHVLISHGVSRSIAMRVYELFERVPNNQALDIIEWLRNQKNLALKPIYKKYLRNLKLISE